MRVLPQGPAQPPECHSELHHDSSSDAELSSTIVDKAWPPGSPWRDNDRRHERGEEDELTLPKPPSHPG